MDKIIRYYWIAWDNSDGTEGEQVIRDRDAAIRFYLGLGNVPYRKLVACYNDHDETVSTYKGF